MKRNFLKLNEAKTEFIVLGSEKQRLKVTLPHLKVGDVRIPPADKVRSLGLLLDANMTMVPQVSNCVRSSVYHLRNINRIRQHLNSKAAQQVVHAFVTSRIDMYNSTYFGLPNLQINRIQKVLNAAASDDHTSATV